MDSVQDTQKDFVYASFMFSLSLSVSVAVPVVSVLLLVCREVIVLEQTPEIIACPAQPATILPAHTQARTTFAAPITLATLRI